MRRSLALALSLPIALTALLSPTVALAKACPNIMLVLDQSGSMSEDPNGNMPGAPGFTTSKWQLLQEVVKAVVQEYGDHVPFGMELFTIGNNHLADDACFEATSIDVEIAHDTAGLIIQKIDAAMPMNETNTNGAIHRARTDTSLADATRGNYIILVTDGDPNCGTDLSAADPMTGIIDGTQMGTSVWEIQQAFAQTPSIGTYVIGFDGSGGVNPENLDAMAFYGMGPGNHACGHDGEPHCYYQAGVNLQDLENAIDMIVDQAGGGEFGGAICDDSCYSAGCPSGQICTTDEQNTAPHCINDPCMGMSCGGSSFCRLGQCVQACNKGCASGTLCQDGACVADLCAAAKCADGQVCDPSSGSCVDIPCPNCTLGSICDVATGQCVTDQCKIVNCPKGDTCVPNGNCEAPAGGGGCSAGGPLGAGSSVNAGNGVWEGSLVIGGGVLLLALVMLLRRRRA